MSLSQTQQADDLHDQLTILIGSAIRLLCGEAGVFVVSNEAYDPQSSAEYTRYRLSESACQILLATVQGSIQPTSARPFVFDTVSPTVVDQLIVCNDDDEDTVFFASGQVIERCSLFLHDQAGRLGVLYYLRPAGVRSCFEQSSGAPRGCQSEETLPLFIAQLSAGLRFALQAHFITLTILGTQHFIVEAPQYLTFTPSSELFHRRIKVNDTQRTINSEDALSTIFKNSCQPSLFFHQRLGLQSKPQSSRELCYEERQCPLGLAPARSATTLFKA